MTTPETPWGAISLTPVSYTPKDSREFARFLSRVLWPCLLPLTETRKILQSLILLTVYVGYFRLLGLLLWFRVKISTVDSIHMKSKRSFHSLTIFMKKICFNCGFKMTCNYFVYLKLSDTFFSSSTKYLNHQVNSNNSSKIMYAKFKRQ